MNLELFNRAVEIIEAVPKKRINLCRWMSRSFDEDCGTICCAGGWLALNPEMQAKGLFPSAYGEPTLSGLPGTSSNFYGYYALAKFFGIYVYDAERLFSPRHSENSSLYAWESQFKTDKELWLARVEHFRQNYSK